ncbi:hypothetical protein MSSAC_1891 [Methanosarcina siciliae C2J]|uniref:Transposase IS66 central domain-containing protein n=1 Tax=Methanosarcina siciliae C2J TaxID=1434118 RepID=A0A0E3LD15_9EURY|nr:transposase [Methanosarcina siciliae]AKB36021.1 hypothetical protein MSSAC_1431 [Methanosarcina siciliae C2J]AKB36481.1 hypothetical protein MSSAC_1891 [Methanosarcina siciliae C2J]
MPNKPRESNSRKDKIEIHHTETCKIDKFTLPLDACFKGYDEVVIRDILIMPWNTRFQIEKYYSPSEGKTYRGKLPEGINGEFGPGIRSAVIALHHISNVSEPKIHEFLENVGVCISRATISRMLTKNIDNFHEEKADIFHAGLKSTTYQQIDDTSARVNGENWYTQILCNSHYTAYFTVLHKDRETILDILLCGMEKKYCLNEEAFDLMETFNVAKIWQQKLSDYKNKVFSDEEMHRILALLLSPDINKNIKKRILEACAIASYHQMTNIPVVTTFLSDDAPQFRQLTYHHALCWIHDGRHYKKLHTTVPYYQEKVKAFLNKYWDYYVKLCEFRKKPNSDVAKQLSAEFDRLFSTETKYPPLDDRISKTKEKKESLLMVLNFPEIPLHNNGAELGARAKVRKRDVSLQSVTDEGTRANDTFMTIVQTARKLSVSAYDYILDRVSNRCEMISLAKLIQEKSALS